jgi:hypothetical protein
VSPNQTLQSRYNCSLRRDLSNTFLPSSGALHVSPASYAGLGLKGRGVDPTTHIRLLVMLRMRGAIPPLTHTFLWHGQL